MNLEFAHPWLVIVAVALALSAAGWVALKRGSVSLNPVRRPVLLFVLGAAAFLVAAARPVILGGTPEVRHAIVVDVSASMESRQDEIAAYVDSLQEATELPAGHSIEHFELSDALRKPPSPRGATTDYSRLADLASDESINGEIILITDGQGELEVLYDAVTQPRLVILRPPAARAPDASIISMRAPTVAPVGGAVRVRAAVACDQDAEIPWRILRDDQTLERGTRTVKRGVPAGIEYTHVVEKPGLVRLRLVLELPGDREPRNDEASVALLTAGRRVILYCVPDDIPPESDGLYRLLASDDRNEVRVRHRLPDSSSELEEAGAVIINNLPLANSGVTGRELNALADWVNGGGNLMMVGATGAFGPGGYRTTPVEDVMPVRFRPDDVPERQVVLLLDASSSMEESIGGERKIDRLKAAGARLLETLPPGDRVAVLGFSEGVVGDAHFVRPGGERALAALQALRPRDSTFIALSLEESLDALKRAGDAEDARIVMITDGEDEEGAGEQRFADIAKRLAEMQVRLDIILTNSSERVWPDWLIASAGTEIVHLWQVGGDGYDNLLETLDRAAADADREWVVTGEIAVEGVGVPLAVLVRTQLRSDESVVPMLTADAAGAAYPLLARRQLLGRTVALCTDTWGARMRDFWQNEEFREEIDQALSFLLQNANRTDLLLNPMTDGGVELVWIGSGKPPQGALKTSAGDARPVGDGRWRLDETPQGNDLSVFHEGRLLQRIPLPEPVPHELRLTGNSDAFFSASERGGLRVFNRLDAWQPRRFIGKRPEPVEMTWLPALIALGLLLAGYASRRR